jgi:hypothetical protein
LSTFVEKPVEVEGVKVSGVGDELRAPQRFTRTACGCEACARNDDVAAAELAVPWM